MRRQQQRRLLPEERVRLEQEVRQRALATPVGPNVPENNALLTKGPLRS